VVKFISSGQLGQALKEESIHFPHLSLRFLTKTELDITDSNAVNALLENCDADYLIHAAAYTAVDKAETEQDLCFAVNRDGSRNIASALRHTRCRMIYISSDYVYHTYNGFPLHEESPVNPQGIYARSKVAGEQAVRDTGIPAMIVRTSWVVSPYGHNFVKTMVRLGKEKDRIQVVNDQFGCITSAGDLARTLLLMTEKWHVETNAFHPKFHTIYNYSNEGCISWYDIACRIMECKEYHCHVHPIASREFASAAPRPQWSVLAKQKIKTNLQFEIPHWITALDCILDKVDN